LWFAFTRVTLTNASSRIAEFSNVDYVIDFLNSDPTRRDIHDLNLKAINFGSGRIENPAYVSTRTTGYISGQGYVTLETTNNEPRYIHHQGNRDILIASGTSRRVKREFLSEILFRFGTGKDVLTTVQLNDVRQFASVDWRQFKDFDFGNKSEMDEIIDILNTTYGLNVEYKFDNSSDLRTITSDTITFIIENVSFDVTFSRLARSYGEVTVYARLAQGETEIYD
jgi:hypothetical protein